MTRLAGLAVAALALGGPVLGGCAGFAARLPGLAARCVSYGAGVVVSLPAGRLIGASAGCIETAPAPGERTLTSSSP